MLDVRNVTHISDYLLHTSSGTKEIISLCSHKEFYFVHRSTNYNLN